MAWKRHETIAIDGDSVIFIIGSTFFITFTTEGIVCCWCDSGNWDIFAKVFS